MANDQRIREVVRQYHDAYRAFKDSLTPNANRPRSVGRDEHTRISLANFHHAAQALFHNYLNPLAKRLPSGDQATINVIIDFLEVDILSLRTGYAKERFLKALKSVPITPQQTDRLRAYALNLCQQPGRREFRYACRLMIHLADDTTIEELCTLASSDHRQTRHSAQAMLTIVLNSRPDLR